MDASSAAPLVARQGGVISIRQLRWLGFSRGEVAGARDRGWLIPLYVGVYAVGHKELTPHGKRWAAILAGGKGTVLSHQSAAAALDFWQDGRVMHVIGPKRIDQPGLRGHRHKLHPGETTKTDSDLPVTTPARTLLDLADVLTPRRLERAYDRARFNRLISLSELDDVLAKANGRRGARKLRAIIDADRPVNATANDFEDALLQLIRANGLPEPEVNHRPIDGGQVDFRWPAFRLIVEADGGQHERPAQSRRDKRRDAENLALGWRTMRFTYRDVTEDPAYVVGVLRQLLT